MAPLLERVRRRLNDLADSRGVQHSTLAEYLGLTRSAVTRMLNDEGSGISLAHVERLCEFFQITPSELVAEPHAVIQALSPVEVAIVDVVRKMSDLTRHALLNILEWPLRDRPVPKGKPRRLPDHLTPEEAMILSLYHAVGDADAQSGIVMQMRGYVQQKQQAHSAAMPPRKLPHRARTHRDDEP